MSNQRRGVFQVTYKDGEYVPGSRTRTIFTDEFPVSYSYYPNRVQHVPWEKCECSCESGCDVCNGTRVVYRSGFKVVEPEVGFPKLDTTWIDTPDGTFDMTGREII